MTVRSSSHLPTRLAAEPAVVPKPPSVQPQSKPVDIPRGRSVLWHVAAPVPVPRSRVSSHLVDSTSSPDIFIRFLSRPHHELDVVEPRLERPSAVRPQPPRLPTSGHDLCPGFGIFHTAKVLVWLGAVVAFELHLALTAAHHSQSPVSGRHSRTSASLGTSPSPS
eukprot:g54817.t1